MSLSDTNRIGAHIWWSSDSRKIADHYRKRKQEYTIKKTVQSIYEALPGRK